MIRYKVDKDSLISKDSVNFSFGIADDFATNLRQTEIYNGNYVESLKEENINDIIDYEKQVFTPMVYTLNMKYNPNTKSFIGRNGIPVLEGGKTGKGIDNYLTPINKITFNLFFREREYTVITGLTWEGKTIDLYRDYGSWNPTDTSYWNNITVNNNILKCKEENLNGDYLIHLGFDDDDVFYQKNALKKSFLRISIYDSPYRETQKLLHYSTIFFDTNKLYKNYMNACIEGGGRIIDDINKNYVTKNKNLTATFTCSNKFNIDSSSDGFYYYLYDKLVSGNTCTQLYMKVEFNNAKFGKTVPFIYPTDSKLNPIITPNLSGNVVGDDTGGRVLPIGYTCKTSETSSGKTYDIITTNMKQLYEDQYIKIMVKFNYVTNSYIWFIPREIQRSPSHPSSRVSDMDGNIVLNLYEPRINNEI